MTSTMKLAILDDHDVGDCDGHDEDDDDNDGDDDDEVDDEVEILQTPDIMSTEALPKPIRS